MRQDEFPEYSTIEVVQRGPVAGIMFTRPKVRNAFNDVMVAELRDIFAKLAGDDSIRVVVLTGQGPAFSAGVDLSWMMQMVGTSYEQNLEDCQRISELLHAIYTHPQPTIARVNGPAIGGGAGIAAACDIVIASQTALFSLSEVRIGMLPACAAPYLIKRLGEAKARELFLTGERLDAAEALRVGLANAVAGAHQLDDEVDQRVELLLRAGPKALSAAKELLEKMPGMDPEEAKRLGAEVLARLRVGDEGQEGMRAFLGKRVPSWAAELPPRPGSR